MKYRLSEICNGITDGSHNPPPGGEISDYPMISSKNISDDCITTDDPRYLTKAQFDVENKRTAIAPGDVLMTIVGTVGRTAVVTEYAPNLTLQRSVAVLHPNREMCSSRYLMYQLRSKRKYFETEAHGVAQKGLYLKQLSDVTIELHETIQQKEIVDTLDSVNSIIRLREAELIRLDELIKARFVELFGEPSLNTKEYPIKSLPEIAEYWNGLTYKPEDVADEGTIVLRSSNIQNAELDFEDTVRVTCSIGEKKYVQNNDILMCSRNGSARLVGKVARIKDIKEPMSFGAFMMIIRSQYYPYLMTFFQMPAFRAQITTGATTTINQITGRMLDNVKLPVPNKAELNSFISFVEQVDKSKVAVQKSLDETQLLFDCLMQNYFG